MSKYRCTCGDVFSTEEALKHHLGLIRDAARNPSTRSHSESRLLHMPVENAELYDLYRNVWSKRDAVTVGLIDEAAWWNLPPATDKPAVSLAPDYRGELLHALAKLAYYESQHGHGYGYDNQVVATLKRIEELTA